MRQIDRLRFFFNRCKPDVPIPADDPEGWYVDFDAEDLRGERCIEVMATRIQLADRPITQLFTGFPGSGKTSELFRLTRSLEGAGYLVVYADTLETVDVLNPIESVDVAIALGLALDERLTALLNEGKLVRWTRRFGHEVKELLFSDVALKELNLKGGGEVAGAEIGLELKSNPSFRKVLRQAANDRRRQFLDQIRTFFGNANNKAREAGFPGGLVVILDNLEKLGTRQVVGAVAATVALSQGVDSCGTSREAVPRRSRRNTRGAWKRLSWGTSS